MRVSARTVYVKSMFSRRRCCLWYPRHVPRWINKCYIDQGVIIFHLSLWKIYNQCSNCSILIWMVTWLTAKPCYCKSKTVCTKIQFLNERKDHRDHWLKGAFLYGSANRQLGAFFFILFFSSLTDVPISNFLSAAKNIKHAHLQAVKPFHLILYLKLPL